jgi:hypothetical protein
MHIGLTRLKNELVRFLPKGSPEQVAGIYEIVRDYYLKTPAGKKEANKIKDLESKIKQLEKTNKPTTVKKSKNGEK